VPVMAHQRHSRIWLEPWSVLVEEFEETEIGGYQRAAGLERVASGTENIVSIWLVLHLARNITIGAEITTHESRQMMRIRKKAAEVSRGFKNNVPRTSVVDKLAASFPRMTSNPSTWP